MTICLASGLRTHAAQSSPVQPLSYIGILCILPSLRHYDAPNPPDSSTLSSALEYRGMVERDRGLLHPCVMLWLFLLVDYGYYQYFSGIDVYEGARSSAASPDYVDTDWYCWGRHENTASDVSTYK